MLRIISHIERLLLIHDCVIVPGFGGFILQSVPATWEKEEHLFIPPKKEIGFNETLHYSDGLLAESYMQQYDIDYQKAKEMLHEDVEDMKKDLKQYQKLSMGVIGTITLGPEGQILFTPSKTKLFSISSYGLTDLHLLPLSILQQEEEKKSDHCNNQYPVKKDTLYIPVSRKFIQIVASTAAAIAAFLIISTPIADVNKESYQASFIPYEVVKPTVEKKNPEKFIKYESEPVKSTSITVIPKTTVTTSIKGVNTASKEAAKTKRTKIASLQNESPKREKMYHAVIASFPNKEQADKYISSIDHNKFASANIIFRNNRYRVYAKRFNNRKEANDYINLLHNDVKYKDAWLFISR